MNRTKPVLGDRVARMDSYVVGTVVSAYEDSNFMMVLWDGTDKPKGELFPYVILAQPYQEKHNKWRLKKLKRESDQEDRK